MIDEKRLEVLRKECVSIEMDDVFDTLLAALRVVRAAQKVKDYYHGKIGTQGALSDLDEVLAPFNPPHEERK